MAIKPANSIAEQVVRLRDHNSDLYIQIGELMRKKNENDDAIQVLEPMAEWVEIPDLPVDEELPNPE